jgi:Domain of unknown function (DUF1996)
MKRTSLLVALCLSFGLVAVGSPTASAHPPGAFVVQCGFSHTLRDDPIVSPGDPGGSAHNHAFYGNRSTNANSTYRSLQNAKTTCTDDKDLAAEWIPTGSYKKNGQWHFMKAGRIRVYYFPSLRVGIDGRLFTIPKNIKIIGGNPHATSAKDNPAVRWTCGGPKAPEVDHPYNCLPYTAGVGTPLRDGVRAMVDFPFCWDGKRLDSADHMSHVIYPDLNDTTPHEHPADCPYSHRWNIPSISVRVHWPVYDPCFGARPCGPDSGGNKVRIRLSSGSYWTMHADFWNAWIQKRLDKLVQQCLRAGVDCGILGVTGHCCPPSGLIARKPPTSQAFIRLGSRVR